MSSKKMELTINIQCSSGIEMENNLNKLIEDFSEALKQRGFSEMELTAFSDNSNLLPIYKLTLLNNE